MNARVDIATYVRPMWRSDIDSVLKLERAAYRFPWNQRIFHDCLRVGYRAWVVTDNAEHILAYCFLSIAVHEAHVLNICVAEGNRGRGLADQLLDTMIEAATAGNAESLLLEVRPSNRPARRLYKRRGFEFLARRPDYYPAATGREDALLMSLPLIS